MRWSGGNVMRLAAAIVVAGAAVWGGSTWRYEQAVDRLPLPPDLSESQAAVRDHVRQAYAAARQAPRAIAAIGALCRAYHADMLYDQAVLCYMRASELAPEDWKWTYRRALIQSERGGGASLVESLHAVVAQSPGFGPAWLRLGEAEFKAGRYDRAEEAWRRAVDLPEPPAGEGSPVHVVEVPLSAYASLGLARIALVRGETDRARDVLERLTASVPQFGSAKRLLAECYRRLGRDHDAALMVYRANRLPPFAPSADPFVDELARESRNATLLLRLASEASLSVNAEWSEYLTRRALEVDPDNPDVVVKLGRILRTVGRNREALGFFQRYHDMVPGDYQGLAHIGSCLSALGEYAEAEDYFRRALAGGDDPLTRYNLGLLLALTGRLDAAVSEYEKSLALDPASSDARLNLATALARLGRVDRASRELERLVLDDPDNAVAHANLGVILLQQGRVDRGREALQEALRLDPRLTPATEALATLEESSRERGN